MVKLIPLGKISNKVFQLGNDILEKFIKQLDISDKDFIAADIKQYESMFRVRVNYNLQQISSGVIIAEYYSSHRHWSIRYPSTGSLENLEDLASQT